MAYVSGYVKQTPYHLISYHLISFELVLYLKQRVQYCQVKHENHQKYSSLLLKRIESQVCVCVCAQGAEDSLDFPEIMCNDSEQHFGSFSSSVPLKILLLVS